MSNAPEHKCCICKAPANDPAYHVRIRGRLLAFCEDDYMLTRQLLTNIPQIFQELSKRGIQVGVPRR